MAKIAVISAILDNPSESQKEFNEIVSSHKRIVKGRLGLPLDEEDVAIISLTVAGEMDQINSLSGKLGQIPNVTVTMAVSKKQLKQL